MAGLLLASLLHAWSPGQGNWPADLASHLTRQAERTTTLWSRFAKDCGDDLRRRWSLAGQPSDELVEAVLRRWRNGGDLDTCYVALETVEYPPGGADPEWRTGRFAYHWPHQARLDWRDRRSGRWLSSVYWDNQEDIWLFEAHPESEGGETLVFPWTTCGAWRLNDASLRTKVIAGEERTQYQLSWLAEPWFMITHPEETAERFSFAYVRSSAWELSVEMTPNSPLDERDDAERRVLVFDLATKLPKRYVEHGVDGGKRVTRMELFFDVDLLADHFAPVPVAAWPEPVYLRPPVRIANAPDESPAR